MRQSVWEMEASRNSRDYLYKMKRRKGSLISVKWTMLSVIVFICVNLCVVSGAGEVSNEVPEQSLGSDGDVIPAGPTVNNSTGDGNASVDVSPKFSLAGSSCSKKLRDGKPVDSVEGRIFVWCKGYTEIPAEIPSNVGWETSTIQHLDMSNGNAIQIMKSGSLSKASWSVLQILNLQNCQILTIQRGAFVGGETLLELDLSFNIIETLDPAVFEGLSRLTKINLRNNHISKLSPNAVFPSLSKLKTIDLSVNSINALPGNVFKDLNAGSTILLNNNSLTTVQWDVFNGTSQLQLNLGENQWKCDCHLRFLREYLVERSAHFLSPDSTQCKNGQFMDRPWRDVPPETMTCAARVEVLYAEAFDLHRPTVAETGSHHLDSHDDGIKLGQQVHLTCEFSGYPIPTVTWLQNDKPAPSYLETKDPTSMTGDKFQYKFSQSAVLRNVTEDYHGNYTCRLSNGDFKTTFLNISSPDVIGIILPQKGAVWLWILLALFCVLILILLVLLTCLIWKRNERKKQDSFRKVVHDKFKDSNIDLGEFDVKATSTPNAQHLMKDSSHPDGATPLLMDNRSETSTILINDHPHQTPLPDVALGNATLLRNSQIFSPKPPPALHGYPTDTRKEFFARQISEPYLRPGSAMSLSRPNALTAAQKRYVFANQQFQSDPLYADQESLYAVPAQIQQMPRAGSAMSVAVMPDDLRRQMLMRQYYQQPGTHYGTAARGPHRRIPSTSSEPPLDNMSAFNYSTLPRRPIRVQNWSRPVSPTNSTCSTYSTLSWRPVDPKTGVMSDGMGARNTAHGGSTTSINRIPDMNGIILGDDGIESMNRAMTTTPTNGGGKVKNGRPPRYGHSRTPSSLTRGHNEFFSFEPIQEVESSECASTQHLDRAGGRQTPVYSTQSLARGEPRYKRKKPPPITMIPQHLKVPSGAFDHLKGRSVSPSLKTNSVVSNDQPKEEPEKPVVLDVPVLESQIDDAKSVSDKPKGVPPPAPPKPKRAVEEDFPVKLESVLDDLTSVVNRQLNDSDNIPTPDGTVV